jgi:DNA mismatch repair protein MutL
MVKVKNIFKRLDNQSFFVIIILGGNMGLIKVMDQMLANKIAAGEVVEKCASVVKELVENSIDAKSTEIKIELEEAGTKRIKVTDNGIGMDRDDAVFAFYRHATSKIITEEDLYHINTLGFRGEALPSIAAVSEITLKTSTGTIGTILELRGGKIINTKNGDARRGTIISVDNLFYNTPARLKYMNSLYSELASVTEYVNKIALSHPEIKITLKNNDKVLLNTDGSNSILKVIKEIYGVEVAKKMIKLMAKNDDFKIYGYISYPEITRSNRNHITLIVNKRVVRNYDIIKTIDDAYHTYKPEDRYPIVVLNIEVDPSLIDVNIHPAKLEVKFSKIESLKDLITETIEKLLTSETLIPEVKEEAPKNYETLSLDLGRETIAVKEETVIYSSPLINAKETKKVEIKEEAPKERFPELYPIGSVHGTYIICQNEDGMYIIDQHAAKERINYEKYMRELSTSRNEHKEMLIPITIEFPKNEYIILKENLDILKELNFEVEEFGINTLIVKAHPVWLPIGYEEQAIRRIMEIVIDKEDFDLSKFNEKIATTLSCKLSVKANEYISIEEMERLIDDLKRCNNPFTCPHGRPTIIHYSTYELEKMFKRAM